MRRFELSRTLDGHVVSQHVELDVKTWTRTWGKPDKLTGLLLKEDFFASQPLPVQSTLAMHFVFGEGEDAYEVTRFVGVIDRVTYSRSSPVVTFEATSMQGWPHLVDEVDEQAWLTTDAGVIASCLFARACHPLDTGPALLTYRACTTGKLLGTPAVDGRAEKPIRTAWYLGSNLGTVFDKVAKDGDIVHREEYEKSWTGAQFATVVAEHRPEPQRSTAVFVGEENVKTDPIVDIKARDAATNVQVIGPGKGAQRLRGFARTGAEHMPRTVTTHTESDDTKTLDEVKAHAHQQANSWRNKLPFARCEVVRDSNLAPAGSYDVGQLVRLDLGDGGRWDNVLIRRIEEQGEDPTTVTLHVELWHGWD